MAESLDPTKKSSKNTSKSASLQSPSTRRPRPQQRQWSLLTFFKTSRKIKSIKICSINQLRRKLRKNIQSQMMKKRRTRSYKKRSWELRRRYYEDLSLGMSIWRMSCIKGYRKHWEILYTRRNLVENYARWRLNSVMMRVQQGAKRWWHSLVKKYLRDSLIKSLLKLGILFSNLRDKLCLRIQCYSNLTKCFSLNRKCQWIHYSIMVKIISSRAILYWEIARDTSHSHSSTSNLRCNSSNSL